jgi:hypothetical protein
LINDHSIVQRGGLVVMTTPAHGEMLAKGVYDYTLDDRPRAKEMWQVARLEDGRVHIQTMLGTGQEIFYGTDVILDTTGAIEHVQVRIQDKQGKQGEHTGSYQIEGQILRGELVANGKTTPVEVTLPEHALILTECIAARSVIGQALDLTSDAEQPLSLCLLPVLSEYYAPLQPVLVEATATSLGAESVDLLMAPVTATHVLLEWSGHPPQHVWFDENGMPVQWYWLGRNPEGGSIVHEYALSRHVKQP